MDTQQRCGRTDKVIYTSERAAVTAIHSVEDAGKAGPGDRQLRAYPCSGHWHIGHSPTRTIKAPKRKRRSPSAVERLAGIEAGTRKNKGVQRDTFTRQEWDEAMLLLWQRCRDLCEWCNEPLQGEMVRHHRQRRGVGGDRLSNLVVLHDRCHRKVHEQPELARSLGFIVLAVTSPPLDPAHTAVTIGGRLWLLDDSGHRRPHP